MQIGWVVSKKLKNWNMMFIEIFKMFFSRSDTGNKIANYTKIVAPIFFFIFSFNGLLSKFCFEKQITEHENNSFPWNIYVSYGYESFANFGMPPDPNDVCSKSTQILKKRRVFRSCHHRLIVQK